MKSKSILKLLTTAHRTGPLTKSETVTHPSLCLVGMYSMRNKRNNGGFTRSVDCCAFPVSVTVPMWASRASSARYANASPSAVPSHRPRFTPRGPSPATTPTPRVSPTNTISSESEAVMPAPDSQRPMNECPDLVDGGSAHLLGNLLAPKKQFSSISTARQCARHPAGARHGC